MSVKDIKMAIFSYMEVVDVSYNGAHLDWQYTANTPFSNWLW